MLNDNLQIFVETVQQLSMARDIDSITSVVRKTARKLTGADGATFVLRDNDLCYYADEDAIAPLWKGQRFPMSTCISGWAMLNRQEALIEDIYADSRIPIEAYRPTFVKSLAVVPIRKLDPIGAIGNYWASHHMPTDGEVQLLQSLADITSVSIENVYIYNELEQRVQHRTKQLEQANAELEAFSYSASHDLRAPLRSFSNYLNIIAEDYPGKVFDDSAQRMISRMLQSASGMNQLIDGLLNFSKSGKTALSVEPMPMKKIVEELCESQLQHEKGRDITFEIGKLPDVRGDSTLITQVWANLIANAIKYTGQKDKSEIKIGFETAPEVVTFYVKDNGAGFDMQYYDKLFGIFQRLHSSDEFAGNGIGLAMVQRIITRHGGKIWAEGQIDGGATFYFTLPVV